MCVVVDSSSHIPRCDLDVVAAAVADVAALTESNRKTVGNLMAKAKETSDASTKTKQEVEAATKTSKEEVARLHATISTQKKLVEEQKKMIARLAARSSASAGASPAGAVARLPPTPGSNKRTADAAKIGQGPAGSGEKKVRTMPPKATPSPAAKLAAAAATPSPAKSAVAAVAAAAGGGVPANPMLAFLMRKEKAGGLTAQQKTQLDVLRKA